MFPILLLVLFNLIIGAITYKNFGDSYDETRIREYAIQSLVAYKSWIMPSYSPNFGGDDLRYYGPAFIMAIVFCVWLVGVPAYSVMAADLWHLAYFVSFQVAVLCIYLLARRWLSNWAAITVAFLFSTQPLLWGHAFINPKDIPFMAFFLASIVSGLWMCDKVLAPTGKGHYNFPSIKQLILRSEQNWRNMHRRNRNTAIIIGSIWLLSVIFLIIGKYPLNSWIANIIHIIYTNPQSLGGRIFLIIAHQVNNNPVENYILKAQTLFLYLRNGYILFGAILTILHFRSVLPLSIHLPSKRDGSSFLRELFLSFMKPPVLIAGIILGLTTSVRVFGPLAGLIVVIYGLLRKDKKSLAPFFTYAIVAVVFMYLTWPYLWSAPFAHLKESITTMSAFPWIGRVLFNGNYYPADKLPGSYLPVLFSIQFTEPVVILFAIGCGIAVYDLVHRRISGLFGISLVWFFIPVSLLILTRRPIYDNFRQILFLVPPIFLICGIAVEAIFRIARKWSMRIAFMILLCIPGIYGIGYLHPYEYTYYNSFAGGIDGAFRKFETDYWMTSYREAAEYLNQTAVRNARIVVWGGFFLVKQYTRPDLIVEPEQGNTYDLTGGYNFAVLSSRSGNDDLYPDEEPVFSINRGNAILAVVKRLSPSSSP